LEYLLFAAYLVLFAWLVTRIRFFTGTGLSHPQLIILFLLKVMAGIFYGWIGTYYGNLAQMVDTWSFHYEALKEYRLLGTDPQEYFTNLFRNPYDEGFLKFLGSTDSYWNDLKANLFIKVLSVLDIPSFGHYYVNVIFFSFISLFGPMAIFRVMNDVFPGKKMTVLPAAFLIPSFIYWTSGIHKDGLIFTGVSFIIYSIYFSLKQKKITALRIILVILGLLSVLLFRNFLLFIIFPALLAWLLAAHRPNRTAVIFATVYIFSILVFFTAKYFNPRFDFPQAVVTKQQDFMKLSGGSSVPMDELQPNAASFLKNIPQAFNLSTLRPYPGDVKHILSLAAAVEINLLLLLFLLFLFFRKNRIHSRPFIWFCVFFSATLLLTIGFTVNNLGAIVRYRSIIIPLLIVPIAAQIDWARVAKLVFNNIKNKNNVGESE
jgi:hypothetical protein